MAIPSEQCSYSIFVVYSTFNFNSLAPKLIKKVFVNANANIVALITRIRSNAYIS